MIKLRFSGEHIVRLLSHEYLNGLLSKFINITLLNVTKDKPDSPCESSVLVVSDTHMLYGALSTKLENVD
jgi:hypothetical protein